MPERFDFEWIRHTHLYFTARPQDQHHAIRVTSKIRIGYLGSDRGVLDVGWWIGGVWGVGRLGHGWGDVSVILKTVLPIASTTIFTDRDGDNEQEKQHKERDHRTLRTLTDIILSIVIIYTPPCTPCDHRLGVPWASMGSSGGLHGTTNSVPSVRLPHSIRSTPSQIQHSAQPNPQNSVHPI